METLEDYLASDYLAETQEIADIERTLKDVMATFAGTFEATTGWPYEYKTFPGTKQAKFSPSQGTLAMVLVATGRVLGRCSLPKKTFAKSDLKQFTDMQGLWEKGLDLLKADLVSSKGVKSSTFGENNPLTLSFISELRRLLKPVDYESAKRDLMQGSSEAQKKLSELLGRDMTGPNDLLEFPENGLLKKSYLLNAFVPLRAIRAASDLDMPAGLKTPHKLFFEKTLHQQLSFSSIPDSRFDPAELIFSLEGLLLCAREAVDSTVFNRVLQVLEKEQDTSAHWRPNKPFIATSQGMIVLPISVEGANSLMRSIAIIDDGLLFETFTAKSLPLLRRFWHWLRARSTRFDIGQQQCVGWHSEHVNEQNLIHIWDTSQVAEFMIFFREMLERHVATRSLRLSGLLVKTPKPIKAVPGKSMYSLKIAKWQEFINTFEPSRGTAPKKQIYRKLKSDFVRDWAGERPSNFSMLLYGPPGTGKTTVAEAMAEALQMPLITVTVSDFLGRGGTNVEARAKAIFQTLESQERAVILFDEIDSFLLDRNSKLYTDQDSLFQFLTPGMLTKINDLRKTERSIFIIATNYADRIDSAIKRTGRIDKQYLLPLPNAVRRMKILESLGFPVPDGKVNPKSRADLEKATAFFGYSDIKGVVNEARRRGATEANLIAILKDSAKATTIESYLGRLSDDEAFPREEFLALTLIAEEVGEAKMVKKAIAAAKGDPKKKKLLKKFDLLQFGSKP